MTLPPRPYIDLTASLPSLKASLTPQPQARLDPPTEQFDHSPAPLTPAQIIGGLFAAWFFLTFLGLTYVCTR